MVRVYKEENFAEFEWMIGGIPVEDGVGREVISRFDSSIKSNGHFYTDANGREMQRRQRNHRETWPLQIDEQQQIAGNFEDRH